MKELPQNYDHKEAEKRWQNAWEKSGVYRFRDDLPREQTFVIDTPPPTVSGLLHMGHIFSYTQADFIARYQRMSGKDVFYPMGFDDNGLPTERLVENTKKVRAATMPRAEFVALCREVVVDAENDFRHLFKSTALSVDWSKEYQTINDDVRALSQASFLDLIKKEEAYRAYRPGYWDWKDGTAIANAEIEEKELPGIQCIIPFGLMDKAEWENIRGTGTGYPSFDSLKKIHVMTTRPEMLGACVAMICHPDDKATYQDKVAVTPLFNVVVPICFDEKVDKEKGTGAVMCCSWGDDTDKEWIAQFDLPWRPQFGKDGKFKILGTSHDNGTKDGIIFEAGKDGKSYESAISNRNCFNITNATSLYQTIEGTKLIRDIKNENSAKGRMLGLLDEAGLLQPQGEKNEKVITKAQMVKCAERSGNPMEIIPTHQWFIRTTDKKDALLARSGEVKWHPDYMQTRMNQWIENLKEDWCISRQRFFGVPFPVWYSKRQGEEGKILYAESNQLPVDPLIDWPKGYSADEVTPDIDVMDTWATSSISPQINAKTLDKCKLFPADMRPQAHEIIRSWAFYTLVKAHLHADTIPWNSMAISGWCLAADKTKMSKSKGNVVTPVALIEEKGTDAVRYWASTSRLGADTAFSEDLLKIGRKLVTKIWNASKFAALNLDKLDGIPSTPIKDTQAGHITEALDLWALSRLNQCIKKSTEAFEKFEYADARVAVEDFFWNDFCDNYLELVKARAYGESEGSQKSALYTLYHCLDAILRLFAPFVPHITEELYSHLFDAQGSVHERGTWPKAGDYPYEADKEALGVACVELLEIARKAKSEAGVSIKYPIARIAIMAKGDMAYNALGPIASDLKAAANAYEISNLDSDKEAVLTDSKQFAVLVELAKQEEQVRNSDQKEHEKITGTILHAKGSPDMSKHVVKTQVNSLPTNLERKR